MAAPPETDLQFRVLGPLEVVSSGKSLILGSPKQRALLALLVMSANRVVAVDRLVEELWGEEAPPRAMASLQAYVSRLRRLLQPAGAKRDRSDVLVTQPPGYVLRVDAGSIDAVRFEHQTAEGIRLLRAGDAKGALDALDVALALWRGTAYADFSFEQFAHVEITRLEELRLSATEARLAALVESGNATAAVAEAEAVVRDHPLREGAWASLMTGLYRSGRQGEALRAYQRARRAIGEEMGIEPGPALQELEAKVLHQSLGLGPDLKAAAPVVALATSESSSPPKSPAPAPSIQEPLVGRDQELQRLAHAVTGAMAGVGRAVLIHGEPGIGKTRLAREVARQAAEAGSAEGHGSCVEGGVAAAYWPWLQALRQILEGLEHVELPTAVCEALVELAQLDAGLRRWAGDIPAPAPLADPELARARLQRAGVDALVGLARLRPLTVVIEDLHWSGHASLQLLSLLGAELASAPLLIVVTYRDEEVGPALAATLAALERVADTVDLALGGLDDASVRRFVELTADQEVSEAVGHTIAARTAGNPLFVAELTRLLRSEQTLREDAVASAPVPTGVRDVIRRRLERLPPQTTAVLTVAAVMGRRFQLALLARVAELSEDDLLDRVESAVAIGLVVEADAPIGTFAFTHDLVRDTLLTTLGGTRRARLHARVAQALLDHRDESDPSRPFELAHHLVQALPLVPAGEVAHHVLAAADAALKRLAFEQAEEQLRRALEVLTGLPAGSERARRELEVLLRLSSLLMVTQGYAAPEAGEVLSRARTLCQELSATREIVPVLWRLAAFETVKADVRAARELADQLLDVAVDSGGAAELLSAHHAVGMAAVHQGDFWVARAHLEQALAMQEVLDDEWLLSWMPQHPAVECSTFLAWTEYLTGNAHRARELTGQAVELAGRLNHDFTTVHALFFDSWMARWTGDLALARQRADEVLELAAARRFPVYAALGTVCRGWARAGQGDSEAGSIEMREGLAAMQATGTHMLNTAYLALLGEAEWQAGHLDRALACVEEGLDLLQHTGERFYEAELYRLHGELLAQTRDRTSETLAEFQAALDVARAQGAKSLEDRVLESLRRWSKEH